MIKLAMIALVGAILIGLCAARWKIATKTLIFFVIFEGAMRKWLLPSLSSELYLLKDLVMIGALLGWMINDTPSVPKRQTYYFSAVGVFAAFGCLQIINPVMGSPLGGVFGLKAYVLWAAYPLLLIAVFRTRAEFERYLITVLCVAVPVCLLAIVQSRLPVDSFLNVYARERSQVDTFGDEGLVRVTGTFPYLAGYANFLIFITVFLLPLTLHGDNPLGKRIGFLLFPLILATSFMTGARWPVFFLGLFLVGYLTTISALGMTKLKSLKSLMLPVVVALPVVLIVFQPILASWQQRASGASASGDTFMSRTVLQFGHAFNPGVFNLMGDGIGSSNNASVTIGEMLGMPVTITARPVEAEPGRVMAELGLIGFLLWYALRIFLIVRLFIVAMRLRDPLLKSLAIAAGWFVTIGIMAPVPFDTTLGAFYWFTAGLSVVLPFLDKKSRAKTTPRKKRRSGTHAFAMIKNFKRPAPVAN